MEVRNVWTSFFKCFLKGTGAPQCRRAGRPHLTAGITCPGICSKLIGIPSTYRMLICRHVAVFCRVLGFLP